MPVVRLDAGRDLRVLVDRLRPVRQIGLGESMKDGEVYHCTIHDVETESRGQMQQHIDREHPGGAAEDSPDEFLRRDGELEQCPTCGVEHTAGSLRYDRNRNLRCPECIDETAPYCPSCDCQWMGDDKHHFIGTCDACGARTSLLPVRQEAP